MSSFSDSVKTRDQLELSHPYGSSGLRYPIHAPKSAAGRATGGTLRSTIISRTFFHIKVTNQMCFDQFWLNTLETKTRGMQTWHVKEIILVLIFRRKKIILIRSSVHNVLLSEQQYENHSIYLYEIGKFSVRMYIFILATTKTAN